MIKEMEKNKWLSKHAVWTSGGTAEMPTLGKLDKSPGVKNILQTSLGLRADS